MPFPIDQSEPGTQHPVPRRANRTLAILRVTLLAITAGCGPSTTFSVSGTVQLDGRPVTAELLFEPLTAAGKRQGQPATIVTQSDGQFEAALPTVVETSSPLPCRISVRIPHNSQGLSSAFDYEVLPDKVVDLRRELSPGQKLTFLITQ
jgi:hypothetical protein